MARKKEFDPDKALDKAMTLFWQKGYEATSIQDLVNHLGIGPRSLYDTFKSKHDLFIATFDRYQEMADAQIAPPHTEKTSPKAIIRHIFESIIEETVHDQNRNGCFLVNCAVELAGRDDMVAVRVRKAAQGLEYKFYDLLDQAQKSGELSTDHDLQKLAQFLANAVFGIRVQAKINPDRQILTNVMNLTLSILD